MTLIKRYRETTDLCKEEFKRLRTAGNDDEECCKQINTLFMSKLFPNPEEQARLESMNKLYVELRKELILEFSELFGKSFLPKMPKELQEKRAEKTQAKVDVFKHIYSSFLISLAILSKIAFKNSLCGVSTK